MRTETDPVTGMQAGAAALGAEERSDEAPRAEDKQERSAPDPEVVAKLRIPVKLITDSGVKPITDSGQTGHLSERSDAGLGL